MRMPGSRWMVASVAPQFESLGQIAGRTRTRSSTLSDKDTNRLCPKCGSQMEMGFLLDNSHPNLLPTLWVKDAPERAFWRLTKIRGKTLRKVESYRCVSCGFLECYAPTVWKDWPQG